MQPHIKTLRAIASVYISDFVMPFFITILSVSAVIVGLGIWLVYAISLWWLLLLIPAILWLLLFGIIWLATWVATRRISPGHLTRKDRSEVREFISSLNNVAEIAATPKIFVGIRIVYDAVFKRNTAYIGQTIDSTRSIQSQYQSLAKRFRD